MQQNIHCPSRLDLASSLAFANRLRELEETEEYCFDFSSLNYTSPFGFLYISNLLANFAKSKPKGTIFSKGHTGKSYHAHMGFFQAFGLKHGNKPGEANGSGNYLPITHHPVSDFIKKAASSGTPIGEAVEESAQKISQILTQQDSGNIVEVLTYSIREIVRNVVEHSNSNTISYCAQYWPSQDRVEIAILDNGDGIYSSLRKNPFVEMKNDHDAIHAALLPSVSGKMFKGIKVRKNDVWQNSGYGLYMTSRLCRHGGNFFIGSGDSSFQLQGQNKTYFNFSHKGTIIRLVMRPSQIGTLNEKLLQFSKEGKEIAKGIKGTKLLASKASQMLTNDFN